MTSQWSLRKFLPNFGSFAHGPFKTTVSGLNLVATAAAVQELMNTFDLVYEDRAVVDAWVALVRAGVRGKRAHDARLAALVLAGKADAILTGNVRDFEGFGVALV